MKAIDRPFTKVSNDTTQVVTEVFHRDDLYMAWELFFTAWDLEPFCRDVGSARPPHCQVDERHFQLLTEFDVAFIHLYLTADNGHFLSAIQWEVCNRPTHIHQLKSGGES